ncbi:hypothetical protein AMECASPLE_019752 [Ameca splendens]|uniref:Uncharacterized protein n=1 Tax=Ameca splendens TaxID=208324 RepID=A0ABV0XG49_9TELE
MANTQQVFGFMNRLMHFLVQSEFVFKQPSLSCCSHVEIPRPKRHITIDQQYIAIARLQTAALQAEVNSEIRGSQKVISRLQHTETERVTERRRSGLLWSHPKLMQPSL